LWNFAGNDYLDLAGDPRVIAAAMDAMKSAGTGARASALVCGRTEWHERLERKLADFEGTEAAILFPTGYAANVGTITSLAGPGDVIYSDRLNHASLIDGCRLSGAKLQVYPHCDVDRLSSLIAHPSSPDTPRRRLIVTDSVFSMDADFAPLPALGALAGQHGAMLIADEAHATGVYGAQGRGLAELQNVEERHVIRVCTLSKALGAQGGFVSGSALLIEWLWNSARTHMYSTALPPATCAAAFAAIEIVLSEPQRRERLKQLSARFREQLRGRGHLPLGADDCPIVPLVLGTPDAALIAAERLRERGFLVGAIRPPSVPARTSRLRMTLTAAHDEQVLNQLGVALESCVDA
jgi:8-amino-7-oxononanoate synthase